MTQLTELFSGVDRLRQRLRRKRNSRVVLLESQYALFKTIAAGASMQQALEQICRTVESFEPTALCSILQLEGGRFIHSVAASSLPRAYSTAIEGREIGEAEGSCGTAMWRREQVIVTDIASSPLWHNYKDIAVGSGLRACWSTPILATNDKVLGSFAVYYRESRAPSRRILDVIAVAVDLASVAMERNELDKALSISRTRYELAQRLANIALWQQDFKTGRRYWSPEFRTMLDIPEDLDPGPIGYSRIVSEDIPKIINAHQAAEYDGRSYEIAYRVRWRNGVIRHLIERGQCSYATDGTLLALTGVMQDETDRRDVTAKLAALSYIVQRANARHSIDDLMQVLVDNSRTLANAHLACVAVLDDATAHYRVACSSSEHHELSDEQSARVIELLQLQLKGSAPLQYMRGESDHVIAQLGMWCMALYTHNGQLMGYLGVVDKQSGDFSEMDDRLLRQLVDIAAISIENVLLYTRMEERVTERTSELQQSNRELEAFSYSVSHDLRGPLRSIAGFTSIIADEHRSAISPAVTGYLHRIQDATARMSKLIDNLLDLSRVGRVPMKHVSVDLSALAAECGRYVAERYPGHHVTFEIDSGLRIIGDPGLLTVVLDNLLDNAWKFTRDQPHPRITFKAEWHGSEIVYALTDNGAGFNPDHAQRLFGAFQRLHTTEEFPGTGIGLASVQRIVLRHGGRVWAKSMLGQGTKIFFTLPEHDLHADDSVLLSKVAIDRVRVAP